MNIAIDVRPGDKPASRYRGIGLYTRQFVGAVLQRNRILNRPHAFSVLTSGGVDFGNGEVSVRRIPSVRKPARLQWVLDRWTLPNTLREGGFDVFHATEFTSIPVSKRTNVIAHVHDMIPFLFWKEYERRIPWDFQWAFKAARRQLAQARYVVTVSECSKKDIAELTGYPEDRICVAYNGGPNIRPSPFIEASPYRARASRAPYFLYVGGTDFRKNVPFLIRGFAKLAEREKDVHLVLVGETFGMRSLGEVDELRREVARLHVSDRVVMMGYVDDESLRRLYCESLALVFPSLYEGFGLPVVEAMTYGAPVLAARTSSIPEVLGDTGMYFDPHDEDSLIAGMEAIYRNPEGCAELVVKAKERAKRFSWDNVAEAVFRLYGTL
jgi:glycosyltransferase involved in cell wall biosynthesis